MILWNLMHKQPFGSLKYVFYEFSPFIALKKLQENVWKQVQKCLFQSLVHTRLAAWKNGSNTFSPVFRHSSPFTSYAVNMSSTKLLVNPQKRYLFLLYSPFFFYFITFGGKKWKIKKQILTSEWVAEQSFAVQNKQKLSIFCFKKWWKRNSIMDLFNHWSNAFKNVRSKLK